MKKKRKKVYVKTVYDERSLREPDITGYSSKEEEAEMMVSTALKWGIGITSCEIIPEEEDLLEKGE